MSIVALAPHNDDETLFMAYSLMHHKPHLVVVLEGHLQGERGLPITAAQRKQETDDAMIELDLPSWEFWPFSDAEPDWGAIALGFEELAERYEWCLAPAPEIVGHEQHNAIGNLAVHAFGADRVTQYMTYVRGQGKSRGSAEVIPEPYMIERKLRALACYRSQIEEPSTRPWFTTLDPMREWLA